VRGKVKEENGASEFQISGQNFADFFFEFSILQKKSLTCRNFLLFSNLVILKIVQPGKPWSKNLWHPLSIFEK
jgi:uncharacterized protein YigE (DUF2233 family)